MNERSQQGLVAIEWVAALALLLLPIVVLVATLPEWAERRHAATVAAREATRVLARVDDAAVGDGEHRRQTGNPVERRLARRAAN